MDDTNTRPAKKWPKVVGGIIVLVVAIRIIGLLINGTGTVSSASPWMVTVNGTSNTSWYGGCESFTANGTSNQNVTVYAPWSMHYGESTNTLSCSFQNQTQSGSGTLTIRYNGQVVGTAQANGAFAVLTAVGDAP